MRSRELASVLVLSSLAAACSGGGGGGGGGDDDDDGATGRVEIDLQLPPAGIPAQDPFAALTDYRVVVLDSAGGTLIDETFAVSDPVEIAEIPAGPDRVVLFEGLDAGTVVSSGRTREPVDFVDGETTTATIYFSRVGVFSTVNGTSVARRGAAVHAFSDGRVLIAGGLDSSGNAILTAQLYEWTANELTGGGTMASGHAYAPVVPLGNDTILIAGGLGGATATDAADVYEHAAGGGSWSAAPAMTGGARREHAGVELGTGRAFFAGGASTNDADGPPLLTTLLFEWDGATGTWTDGPDLLEPRMGAIGLAASGDVAIIAGGFNDNNNVGGGGDDFSRRYESFSWDGAQVDATGGNTNVTRRGWTGVVPTATDEWIVFGGEEDGGGLVADTERFTVTGTTLSSNNLDDLPDAQRAGGGGALADGRVLVLGGISASYPTETPTTFGAIYDPVGDSFAPVNGLPAASTSGFAYGLPDGTALVVIDGGVWRFNPPAP